MPRTVPAPGVPPTAPAGAPAWQRFALAAPDTGGRPMIAIVIDDMGLDRKRSARAVGLPGPLTLSYLTYADDLDEQMAAARSHGHELLLHVSMEPASRTVDPGPNVLLTDLPPEEIRRRLAWGLERASGYVGINNHMGSKFTGDAAAMAIVMAELRRRGLLFLDSRTTPDSSGGREARRAGVPLLERNVFLDNDNEVAAVNARLAEAERIARHHGTAIAIGHPRDATLEALAAWVSGLTQRGFVLVPLTAILRAGTAQASAG
ncbi:MAG: divergent polysaccharide deacetylase family protein [Rhodospirillales bacterium]|nr:divergent polysaccharide deacetylase family protein [Rhodospirillales bacterium]